jgi:hypothetical protein
MRVLGCSGARLAQDESKRVHPINRTTDMPRIATVLMVPRTFARWPAPADRGSCDSRRTLDSTLHVSD